MKKILVIFLCVLLLASCTKEQRAIEEQRQYNYNHPWNKYIPEKAENIEEIDSHWAYFEMDGRKFLIGGWSHYTAFAITEISDD
jgi:hypothetical protein